MLLCRNKFVLSRYPAEKLFPRTFAAFDNAKDYVRIKSSQLSKCERRYTTGTFILIRFTVTKTVKKHQQCVMFFDTLNVKSIFRIASKFLRIAECTFSPFYDQWIIHISVIRWRIYIPCIFVFPTDYCMAINYWFSMWCETVR